MTGRTDPLDAERAGAGVTLLLASAVDRKTASLVARVRTRSVIGMDIAQPSRGRGSACCGDHNART
jgi:hypothetical protein